jgi:hypothetical protein
MKRFDLLLMPALVLASGIACAQSTGSFSSPSTGSGAAGSSPVGTVLPYTVQSGSTAPTQPGHTMTGDRPGSSMPAHASSRDVQDEREKDSQQQSVATRSK